MSVTWIDKTDAETDRFMEEYRRKVSDPQPIDFIPQKKQGDWIGLCIVAVMFAIACLIEAFAR